MRYGGGSPVCQSHLSFRQPCRGQYNIPVTRVPAAAYLTSRLCPALPPRRVAAGSRAESPPAPTCGSPPPFLRGDSNPEALQKERGKGLSRHTGLRAAVAGGEGAARAPLPPTRRQAANRCVRLVPRRRPALPRPRLV